jgi:prepilin-type N-terminal cleavage/methylation domain-containing protein
MVCARARRTPARPAGIVQQYEARATHLHIVDTPALAIARRRLTARGVSENSTPGRPRPAPLQAGIVLARQACMMRTTNRGFTLVEILLVIVVISILAAIAIPHYANARGRGLDAKVTAVVRGVAASEEAYYAGHQRYTSALDQLDGLVRGDVAITIESGNSGDLASSFRVRGTLAGAPHAVVWVSDPAPGEPHLSLA